MTSVKGEGRCGSAKRSSTSTTQSTVITRVSSAAMMTRSCGVVILSRAVFRNISRQHIYEQEMIRAPRNARAIHGDIRNSPVRLDAVGFTRRGGWRSADGNWWHDATRRDDDVGGLEQFDERRQRRRQRRGAASARRPPIIRPAIFIAAARWLVISLDRWVRQPRVRRQKCTARRRRGWQRRRQDAAHTTLDYGKPVGITVWRQYAAANVAAAGNEQNKARAL